MKLYALLRYPYQTITYSLDKLPRSLKMAVGKDGGKLVLITRLGRARPRKIKYISQKFKYKSKVQIQIKKIKNHKSSLTYFQLKKNHKYRS